jgi:hypothetical protein
MGSNMSKEVSFFLGEGSKPSKGSGKGHHSGPRAKYHCSVCGGEDHNARRHSSEGSAPRAKKGGEAGFSFGEGK